MPLDVPTKTCNVCGNLFPAQVSGPDQCSVACFEDSQILDALTVRVRKANEFNDEA